LDVEKLSAEQIGDLAAAYGVTLHELVAQQASLEEAFMELTQDAVEYQSTTAAELAGVGGASR
jgi:ABC-2 type transport system ATP-binding protein